MKIYLLYYLHRTNWIKLGEKYQLYVLLYSEWVGNFVKTFHVGNYFLFWGEKYIGADHALPLRTFHGCWHLGPTHFPGLRLIFLYWRFAFSWVHNQTLNAIFWLNEYKESIECSYFRMKFFQMFNCYFFSWNYLLADGASPGLGKLLNVSLIIQCMATLVQKLRVELDHFCFGNYFPWSCYWF